MNSPVLVTGATGQVGLHVIDGLLKSGREVVALVRNAAARAAGTKISGLTVCGPVAATGLLSGALQSFTLVSCGPITVARDLLGASDRRPGVGRVVATGTTSLAVKQDSPDLAERRAIGKIARALESLVQACREQHIPLAVFHPTLIYGCGMDQNVSPVYRWIKRFGWAPLAARADGLRQPVHVADVAEALVGAANFIPALEFESPLCGGETLPYREMIGRLFEAAGKKRRMVKIPAWLTSPAAGFGNLLPGVQGISAEMFRRQSQDLVFDDTPAREALGHRPRGFSPSAADFEPGMDIGRIRSALQC